MPRPVRRHSLRAARSPSRPPRQPARHVQSHPRRPPARRRDSVESVDGRPSRAVPARVDTSHPTRTGQTCCPLLHRYCRTDTNLRHDLELVHKTFGSGQPEAKAAGGGEANAQCLPDVGNARAVVSRDHNDTRAPGRFRASDDDLATLGVEDDVADQFRDDRRDQRRLCR